MLDLIFDRTEDDVRDGTSKGYYRYTDMNRVQAAVAYLRGLYVSYGYDMIPSYTLPTWAENDIPKKGQGDTYIRAVRSLDGLVPIPGKPTLPTTMNGLNYSKANAIERFLAMTETTLESISGSWFYCDEVFSGEVDV